MTEKIPKGACCAWSDFWPGFVETMDRHKGPTDEVARAAARKLWRLHAMTGYEAAITHLQDIGRLTKS